MQRTTSIGIATAAIGVFILILIASSFSSPIGNRSELAILPTPTQVSALQPNSNGAMVRANVHGTGVFVTKGVRQLTGLKWKFKINDSGVNTTPVINGSIVYLGGYNGRLYAVATETGIEKWNRRLDNVVSTSAPAIVGDQLFVGAWEVFYAMNANTGNVQWTFQPENGSDDAFYGDPVVDGGTVYFGGSHYFYALDSETGHEEWKLELSRPNRVPVVYDGTIYVGTFSAYDRDDNTYLYALDSKTGQEKWKHKATGGGIWGAVAVTDGIVYTNTADDGLLALDAKSGQEKWSYNPGSGVITAPAVAYGTVYITDQGTLYAIDAQTGKEKWKCEAGISQSDPVIADGIVYFTTVEGNLGTLLGGQLTGYLYAVDAQSGQVLWKFSVPGNTSRAPAVADGTVYFGSDEGHLYAVK